LFLRSRQKFLDLPLPSDARKNLDWFRKKPTRDGETLSFRICGRVAAADHELRAWWVERVGKQRQEVVARLRSGVDGFIPGEGPITEYFPTVFDSVPFASFNKAPFVSYGLGSQTATFRLESAEKAAAVLNVLLGDRTTHLKLGDETAVFWAVNRQTGRHQSADFLSLLDQPDPLAVRDYLQGMWGARQPQLNTTDFHVAILLKGTGRFSVRSWHTDMLASADRHVRNYFKMIQLADRQDEAIALRDLAWATIAKVRGQKTKPTSAVFNAIFLAAWRGTPIPYSVFAAVIQRQRLEMAGGDTANKEFGKRLRARTALIQLYFALGKNFSPTEERMKNTEDAAILCGRLLALLDKIHEVAHSGKNASSPANRLYGAASATPALVFPRLCQLARYHLQKMGGGMAYKLEFGVAKDRREDGVPEDFEGLAAIVARLNEVSEGNFPRLLSLEDQGRFALGFYYERNRRWPNFKDGTHGASNTERSSV
jgi:CRISPR-associated protein Csd1